MFIPYFEYNFPVWNPWLIRCVERVQCFFTHALCKQAGFSYLCYSLQPSLDLVFKLCNSELLIVKVALKVRWLFSVSSLIYCSEYLQITCNEKVIVLYYVTLIYSKCSKC